MRTLQPGDRVYFERMEPRGATAGVRVRKTIERGKLPLERARVVRVVGETGEAGVVLAMLEDEHGFVGNVIPCAVMLSDRQNFDCPLWAEAFGVPAPAQDVEKWLDNEDAQAELIAMVRECLRLSVWPEQGQGKYDVPPVPMSPVDVACLAEGMDLWKRRCQRMANRESEEQAELRQALRVASDELMRYRSRHYGPWCRAEQPSWRVRVKTWLRGRFDKILDAVLPDTRPRGVASERGHEDR